MSAHLKAIPTALSFQTAPKRSFTLHNDGTVDVHVISITLSGPNHTAFSVKPPHSFTVAKNGTHAVEVDLQGPAPSDSTLHATLAVNSNAPVVYVSLTRPAIVKVPGPPQPKANPEQPATGPGPDAPSGDGWGVNSPVAGDGGCFIPDTHVLVADGTSRRIDELAAGDAILAIDERDHASQAMPAPRPARVEEIFRHDGHYALLDVDGIHATPVHRWGVRDGGDETGFARTDRIVGGATAIRIYDGKSVGWRSAEQPTPAGSAPLVFNFRSSARTYLVGAGAEGPWYVVHNAKKKDGDDDPPKPPSDP